MNLSKNKNISSNQYNPIICAFDTSDSNQVYQWLDDIDRTGCMAKVGLELFSCSLAQNAILSMACGGVDVFLDLKFYDIPNTVHKSIQNLTRWKNIKMLTVHGSGESDMIKAAVDAAEHIDVIAVTVLTSSKQPAINNVLMLTEKSLKAGAVGVVCSAREVKYIRDAFGDDFKIIVPGVRPIWYNTPDDQTRTGTPKEIMNDGADYLVIGRPITTAPSPREAIHRIKEELK